MNRYDECLFLLLYNNKENNFLYNLKLCLDLELKVTVFIDFPKHDKNFIKNFSRYKEIVKIIKSTSNIESIISNKFIGCPDIYISYVKSNKADNIVIVENDYIITKAFIKFTHTIIKNEDFIIGTGSNFFEKGNKHFYTKTPISLPTSVPIYRTKFFSSNTNLKKNIHTYVPKTDLVFKNIKDEKRVITNLPKHLNNYKIQFKYLPYFNEESMFS